MNTTCFAPPAMFIKPPTPMPSPSFLLEFRSPLGPTSRKPRQPASRLPPSYMSKIPAVSIMASPFQQQPKSFPTVGTPPMLPASVLRCEQGGTALFAGHGADVLRRADPKIDDITFAELHRRGGPSLFYIEFTGGMLSSGTL